MIYDIAGLRIDIKNRYEYTSRFCAGYLSKNQDLPCDIQAVATDEEIETERTHDVRYSNGYLENICLYRSLCLQLPQFDRMLMHAAILEYDGAAYAFLGRSGTGKSTHTGLWLDCFPAARIINGDKPILSVSSEEVVAYGTPWMGKEGRGENAKAPLKGMCFLQQSKENSIRPLSLSETTSRLFTQLLLPSEESAAEKTLELADRLLQNVPAYLLCCDISEEAVRLSFEALTGKTFNDCKCR